MKLVKYSVTGIIVALFLTACSVGKKYVSPDVNIPENFRDNNISVTADTVMLPWKTFFKDPVLIGLIEKALDKNNDIAVALITMQQLDLSYKQAKLNWLPIVDVNIGANRNWLSQNSLNGSLSQQFIGTNYMDDYTASLRMNWEIDIWGKTKMQKETALADYFAQKENLSALKTRIITQVTQAYYNLISLDQQLKVARKNIALSDSTLYIIQLQYNSAQVSSLAVSQAEAQKKTAELLIPLALQNISVQENTLSILCGSYPDSVQRAESFLLAMPEEIFPVGVPAHLLSHRPDVKAAEYAVVSANSKTGLSKAAMYPTLSLTPSIGANSLQFNTWFDLPGSVVKTVGANLLQPVFQQKKLKTAYEIALLEQQKSAVQFRQIVMTAVGEVSNALAVLEQTNQRIKLIEEKQFSLNKATTDAMLLYRSGMANYLEVITAQNNALQNELDEISIKKEKLNALTDLYRALGGGTE